MARSRKPDGTQKIRKKITSKKAKLRRRRRMILAGVILVCAVAAAGAGYYAMYRYVSLFSGDKICSNIYAGNVELSGMTEEEAKAALHGQLEEDMTRTVTVRVGGESEDSTLKEYGLTFANADEAAADAVRYGKTGSLWNRFLALRKLEKEKVVFSLKFGINREAAGMLLTSRAAPLAGHAKNASIRKDGSGFSIEKEEAGETVDIDASISGIESYLNDGWDHESFAIDAVVKKEKPKIKAEDLESIHDLLGSFSTDAGEGERWKNLKNGVDKLNGSVLMPGEELSVHDKTAPYEEENGYVVAGAYENGQVVDSVGGGICQVSTTLYNAVLYAELEVVKRAPHSMTVSYVDPSRDAAIAGDYKDFIFKNSTDTPIYIFGEIDSRNQLCFEIYGRETREAGRSLEFETETVSTEEPKTVYKTNSEQKIGYMETVKGARTGREVKLWKIIYINGQETDREVVNTSVYEKVDRVIEVGTKSSSSDAISRVESAVASQDGDKIRAAINGG